MTDDLGGGASRSTDPAAGSSAATDVSLREHVELLVRLEMKRIEERFRAVELSTEKAFENSQRAIDKADVATEKRFEGVNEFRAALSDQATRFVTQDQLMAQAEKLESGYMRNREDIEALGKRIDIREGQVSGSRITWGNIVAIIAAVGTLIGIVVVTATYLSTH